MKTYQKGHSIKRKAKQFSILRTTMGVVELIPNLLFWAIYAGAMLSPFISPTKTQIPAFLNLGFVLILAVLAFLWLFYLIRRKWGYFLVYTGVVFLSWGYIFSYFPINLGHNLNKVHDLRVMTYNVEGFIERGMGDKPLVPALIREYGADIVALQEANYYPDNAPQTQKIKRLLKDYPYVHVYRSQSFASKFPIKAKEKIRYESYGNGSHAYLLEAPNGKKILVVNNHMESYSLVESEREEYKGYLRDLRLKDLPKQFMAVKRRLGPNLNQRAFAAECVHAELKDLQEKYQPDLTIVLGDLNDTPKSYTYHQLRSGMRDAYAETGLGLGVSFNDRWMPFRIDHLFYEGEAKAIGSKIPKYKEYSDHNPLIVDFNWK